MRQRRSARRTAVGGLAFAIACASVARGQGAGPAAPPSAPPAPSAGVPAEPSPNTPSAPSAPASNAAVTPPPVSIPPVMPASPGPVAAPPAAPGAGPVPSAAPTPAPGSPPAPLAGTPFTGPARSPPDAAEATASPPADTGGPGVARVSAPLPAWSLGLELAAGMTAGARFPETGAARSVEEAVDATYGLSVWVGSPTLVVGLGAERVGLGKDHYATNANGETKEATYGADVLSLLGRWYLTGDRPSMYLGLALGPSLPTVRATGTRAGDGLFVTPGQAYTCSDTGKIGGAASATVGVEFEVARGLSLLADARATGFAMSRSASAFGACAPGTGAAVVGAARLGVSYRFGL